jgi:hypothetical protein
MLLSVVKYLDRAAEYDRKTREATKRSDTIRYANVADCYRCLAMSRTGIGA